MATTRRLTAGALLALLWLALSGSGAARVAAAPASPLRFVANAGQMDGRARFQLLGGRAAVWLDEGGLWLSLPSPDGTQVASLRVALAGLEGALTLEPLDRQPGHVSYYAGQVPADWQERLPVWGAVRYRDAAGHTATIRGDGDLLTVEGAGITLAVEGAPTLPTEAGALRVALPWGAATLPLRLTGGEPPRAMDDPPDQQLLYSTYIGTIAWDEATTLARDPQGRLYAAGHTLSLVFPEGVGVTEAPRHAIESFVVRLLPGGTEFDYLFFLNADVEDFATGLVLDAQNRAFVVGYSDSVADFPATPGAFDTTPNGSFDAYVLRIEADGTLGWATLLGGPGSDTASAIALDSQGRPIITGGTWSAAFPTTANAYSRTHAGDRDIFVSRLSADGSALLYSTFIGGSSQEQAEAMALDAAGGINLVGWTRSPDLPVTPGAISSTLRGSFDAFAMRLAPAGNALTLSTYIGGSDVDRAYALLAEGGELIVAGQSASPDFPTTADALDPTLAGGSCDFARCPDAFLLRLDAATGALTYGSYLGGDGWDEARALALGSNGLLVGGTTGAAAFPTTVDAFDRTLDGPRDGFLTLLSPQGTVLRSSTLFGGSGVERINALWAEEGQVWVAGVSDSANLPTTPDGYDRSHHGDYDAFVAAFTLPTVVEQDLYLPLVIR